MNENAFDILIIGGGQAGIPLAYGLAGAGRRVALAERKNLGGSCINFGCTPTKAAIASARVAHMARRGAEFGIKIPSVEIDFPAVLERARNIVLKFRSGLEKGFENSGNPKLLRGHARFEGRDGDRFRVRVNGATVSAGQVVIDTGTRSVIPAVDGLQALETIHAGNWLDHRELPEQLAILGGGVISLEMSQFYRRMGSRVTVIEKGSQAAAHEDEDIASALQKILESEGVEFRLNSPTIRAEARGRQIAVTLGNGSEVTASHLFVAAGRRPNTNDLGLETVGVKVSDHGIVEVDERLATNVKGIWAAGDIRGGPMFTHTSWDDFRILMSQIAGDGSRTTKRVVPYAIFTDPELGVAGMTEREAKKAGRKIRVGRFDMKDNGKATEIGETSGFIKMIAEEGTNQILGAAVLANEGGELIHLIVDVMNARAPYTVIRDAVHIHPTLAEAVQSAVATLG